MTSALANKQGQLAPLKNVDPNEVLERYLAEETSADIAKSLGVTRSALSLFMLKNAEEQWKSAQIVKALNRKDEADNLIETADNPLDLARAREKLKSAQWDLERVCKRIYGQDTAPGDGGRVSIVLNIGAGEPLDVVAEQPISLSHAKE